MFQFMTFHTKLQGGQNQGSEGSELIHTILYLLKKY